MKETIIFTVGHSTHDIDVFKKILKAHGIEQLIDIRTVPRSRHNPQYNFDTFPTVLRNIKIGYRHMKILGGLRHPRKDSKNTGWRTPGFRGFADYMETEFFLQGLTTLIEIAQKKRVAIMCAEAVPWRCHRSLIADSLLVRGIRVEHIFSSTQIKPHKLTPFAKVRGKNITYS